MSQEFENKWCTYCMSKTKHELIYLPKIATLYCRRKYKCTICGKTIWLRGRRPAAECNY